MVSSAVLGGIEEASKVIQNNVHPTGHLLEATFKGDVFFTPIMKNLLGKTAGDSITERRKAMHRAEGFMFEDNKLWCVRSKARGRVPKKLHPRDGYFLPRLPSRMHRVSPLRKFWSGQTQCPSTTVKPSRVPCVRGYLFLRDCHIFLALKCYRQTFISICTTL